MKAIAKFFYMIYTLVSKAWQAITGPFLSLCRHCEEAEVRYYADEAIPKNRDCPETVILLRSGLSLCFSQNPAYSTRYALRNHSFTPNMLSLFKTVNGSLNTSKEKTEEAKHFSAKQIFENQFSEKTVLTKTFQKPIFAKKFQKRFFQNFFEKDVLEKFCKIMENHFTGFFHENYFESQKFFTAKRYDPSFSKMLFSQNIFAAANCNA